MCMMLTWYLPDQNCIQIIILISMTKKIHLNKTTLSYPCLIFYVMVCPLLNYLILTAMVYSALVPLQFSPIWGGCSLFTLYLLSTIQLYFIFQVLPDKLLFLRLLNSHGDLDSTVTIPRLGYGPCNAPPSLRHPPCLMVTQATVITSQSVPVLLDQQRWKD